MAQPAKVRYFKFYKHGRLIGVRRCNAVEKEVGFFPITDWPLA